MWRPGEIEEWQRLMRWEKRWLSCYRVLGLVAAAIFILGVVVLVLAVRWDAHQVAVVGGLLALPCTIVTVMVAALCKDRSQQAGYRADELYMSDYWSGYQTAEHRYAVDQHMRAERKRRGGTD